MVVFIVVDVAVVLDRCRLGLNPRSCKAFMEKGVGVLPLVLVVVFVVAVLFLLATRRLAGLSPRSFKEAVRTRPDVASECGLNVGVVVGLTILFLLLWREDSKDKAAVADADTS